MWVGVRNVYWCWIPFLSFWGLVFLKVSRYSCRPEENDSRWVGELERENVERENVATYFLNLICDFSIRPRLIGSTPPDAPGVEATFLEHRSIHAWRQ